MRCSCHTMFLRTLTRSARSPRYSPHPPAAPRLTIQPLKPCYIVGAEGASGRWSRSRPPGSPRSARRHLHRRDPAGLAPMTLFVGAASHGRSSRRSRRRSRDLHLRLAEQGTPANTVPADVVVTRLPWSSRRRGPRPASGCASGGAASRPTAPVYAHYVFAGRSANRCGSAMPKGPCGTFSIRRKQFPFKKKSARRRLDDPVRPAPALRPGGPSAGADDDQGPQNVRPSVGLSGALTRPRGEAAGRPRRRPPRCCRRSRRSPLSRPSASGSTSDLEITRFSGRAPYAGS